ETEEQGEEDGDSSHGVKVEEGTFALA
ncbi:MAG: hypothetical protein RJB55_2440, partial [Verrucomicrobiota bacterium]